MVSRLVRLFSLFALVASVPNPVFAQAQTALADAVFGKQYSVQLSMRLDGYSPFTFVIEGGALPSCLRLSPATGIISGTASEKCQGTYSFTVAVNDQNGSAACTPQQYVLHVTDGKTTVAQTASSVVVKTNPPTAPVAPQTPVTQPPPPGQKAERIPPAAAPGGPKPRKTDTPKTGATGSSDAGKVGATTETAGANEGGGGGQQAPAAPAGPTNCVAQVDSSKSTAELGAVDIDPTSGSVTGIAGDAISGKVPGEKDGTVQVCVAVVGADGRDIFTQIGSPAALDASGEFTVTLVGSDKKSTVPSTMKKPIAAGQRIVAQWITTSATGSPVYGPVSEAAIAGECDRDAVDSTIGAPTLDAIKKGDTAFSGRAPKDVTGSVRICVDGFQSGAPAQIGGGAFSGVPIPTLAAGSVVVAQAIESKKYGRFSDVVVTGTCSSAITDLQVGEPTLASVPAPGGDSVTGTVPLSKDGIPTATFVRICLDSHSVANEQPNDLEVAVAEVDSNGNFRASLPAAVKGGNSLVAQGFTTSFNGQARKYGLPIESKDVGPRFNGPFSSFIAGAEQSAYSSDDIETNAFVSAFIRSGYLGSKHGSWSLWGRVRLLSAPQQSAPNIVATIANPTGQITQSSLSSVGAVTDYVLGPEWRLRQHDGPAYTTRFSLIGDLGETTPLSTANPTIFNAPAPNTTDCANLIGNINQMSSPPPLTSGNGLTPPTCLENPASQMPYNYVAYTQQKRSGFLAKYGAGVRFSQVSLPKTAGPSPYAGMLDATLGQDDTITGGKLHKLVFRLDGQYPIPLGTLSSYLYIFGSSSIKIAPNKDLPTINLGVVQSNVPTIPNPQVLVLPTQQPDRDFYRLGVGLNLMDVFCKVFNTPCNSQQSQTATAASTPAATKPLAGGTGAAQPAAGSTKGAKGGAKDAGNSNPAQ